MMDVSDSKRIERETWEVVVRQLNTFWPISGSEKRKLMDCIEEAIKKTDYSFAASNRIYYWLFSKSW